MNWTVDFEGTPLPVESDDSDSKTVVILAAGAGVHMNQKTVLWLADLIRERGVNVVRFNFQYRVLGKGMPDRMPSLIRQYRAIEDSVGQKLNPQVLVVGGHSMGGRTASMMEAEWKSADGLLLFGYPLHPAGQPNKLRDEHLPSIKTPTLQLNGTKDELCTPELMEAVLAKLDPNIYKMTWIEGADHSYGTVKKTSGRGRSDVEKDIRDALANWPILG